MFERYNEHARRVIFCARFSASQSNSTAIESEHLLLGLLREAQTLLIRVSPALPIEDLFRKIPFKVVFANPSVRLQMPLSGECKRILNYSAEEANDLDHRFIGAEHLLLGILRESECFASRVLSEANLHLDELRQQISMTGPEAMAEATFGTPEVERDLVHSLIDKLPESMLAPVKDVIDRMLSRSAQVARESNVRVMKAGHSAHSADIQRRAAETSGSGPE